MVYLRFLWSLLRHKWFVLLAGRLVGVPLLRLLIHDWSKFSLAEFGSYARAGRDFANRDRKEWAAAWFHHLRLNQHHAEYWLLAWRGAPDFYTDIGESVADNIVVLPMPEVYVREMIADFLASSMTYTGKWDIAIWLNKNGPKMHLHSETAQLLASIMIDLGYLLTDNCLWSFMAGTEFRAWAVAHD